MFQFTAAWLWNSHEIHRQAEPEDDLTNGRPNSSANQQLLLHCPDSATLLHESVSGTASYCSTHLRTDQDDRFRCSVCNSLVFQQRQAVEQSLVHYKDLSLKLA